MDKLFYYLAMPFFIPHLFVYVILRSHFLKEDVRQWGLQLGLKETNEFRLFFRLIITLKEFRNVFYYRIGGLRRLLCWYAPGMPTLFIVTPKGNIDSGFIVQHGHSSRIGMEKAGKNLQVWHNVTIGRGKQGGKRPVVGHNVKIMTGAIVLGDITIGNNVVIGAGTLVIKSVPDNCLVVGNPARIVKKDGVKVNIVL